MDIVGRPELAWWRRQIVIEKRRNSKVISQMKVPSSQKREEKVVEDCSTVNKKIPVNNQAPTLIQN